MSAGRGGFNWLKGLALPLGLAIMELCWLTPWSLLLGAGFGVPPGRPLLGAPALLALLLTGRALLRLAARGGWPLPLARLTLVGVGLLAVLLAVRLEHFSSVAPVDPGWLVTLGGQIGRALVDVTPPVAALVFGLVVWSRGLAHGRATLDDVDLIGRFQVGLGLLLLFLLLTAVLPAPARDPVLAAAGPYLLVAVFAGLTTLALARLETVREAGRSAQRRAPALNRHWLLTLLGVVAALLLVTVLIGELLSVGLIGTLLAPIARLLLATVITVLLLLALPVAYLVDAIVEALRRALPAGQPQRRNDGGFGRLMELLRSGEALALSPELMQVIQWLLTGLAIAAGLTILARAVFWWRDQERRPAGDEERDSVWSWRLVTAALRRWWAALRGRLGRPPSTPAAASPTAATAPPAAVTSIRQVYRQLLALGAAAGAPRPAAATPDEHLPRLRARLGEATATAAITRAYVAARYGPTPPSAAETEAVRRHWQRLTEAGPPGAPAAAGQPGATRLPLEAATTAEREAASEAATRRLEQERRQGEHGTHEHAD